MEWRFYAPAMASAMRSFFLATCATISVAACSDEPTEREELERHVSAMESRCAELTVEYNRATIPQFEAEMDIAAAENLDSISPEREWEIRAELGAQMGLHPSEVNGWKQIYQTKAEHAVRDKEATSSLVEEARQLRDEACNGRDRARAELRSLPSHE